MPTLATRSHHDIFKNWKILHLLCRLDRLFSIWNNAMHHMIFWVCAAGTYRAITILGRVHSAFFNYHHFNEVTNMPDEIVLARILTGFRIQKGTALPWQGIWQWQWLWTTRSSSEAFAYFFSLNNWGLFQTCRLQGSTMSHPSLHTMVTQECFAFPPRSLPMPNLWWDTPTRNGLWHNEEGGFPYSWPWWPSMVWRAYTNTCSSTWYHAILPDQQPHPHNPLRKKYPQSQNKWIWKY